jgi:hypothetical protein
MTEKQINIKNLDRGDKTQEQLESEMSPEALALVAQMEEKTIAEAKVNAKTKRRFYRRNRKAWDRMNRKGRIASVARGAEKILNLMAGIGFVTDAAIKEEIPA